MKKRQPHKNIPKNYFEEEQGQGGFYGRASHLIRENPSTRWTQIEGSLKPRMFNLIPKDKNNSWKPVLYNDGIVISFLNVTSHNSQLFKSANGDLLYFCHKGGGSVLTEYGLLNYHAGQYIVIPKCLSHVFVPVESSQFFVVESLQSHFEQPDRGLLGRHALYDSTSLTRPDLQALKTFLKDNNLEFKKLTIHHNAENTKETEGKHEQKTEQEKTHFLYDKCLFDVDRWQGDLFPYTLSMDDIMPVMSHRVHLPPSVHSTFVTKEFIVCSFLPRPLEQDEDALKVPFYHQNTDYAEAIFYHDGDFFSRDNLEAGMMSFHPAGFPHGPHPKAIKNIEGKNFTNEKAVMIDSKQALKRFPYAKKIELKNYHQSWK